MTFEVETGTGSSTANSYESVADFKTYHNDRRNIISIYGDTRIQSALINATDYIEKRFGRRFKGFRQRKDQALEWPRSDAFDNDGYVISGTLDDIPRQLKKATNEYALLVLQLDRNLAPVPQPNFPIVDPATGTVSEAGSGSISSKKEVVGPIEEETRYSTNETLKQKSIGAGSSIVSNIPEYPQADLWLEELLNSSTSKELSRG